MAGEELLEKLEFTAPIKLAETTMLSEKVPKKNVVSFNDLRKKK
jgi:hypothetical protein